MADGAYHQPPLIGVLDQLHHAGSRAHPVGGPPPWDDDRGVIIQTQALWRSSGPDGSALLARVDLVGLRAHDVHAVARLLEPIIGIEELDVLEAVLHE